MEKIRSAGVCTGREKNNVNGRDRLSRTAHRNMSVQCFFHSRKKETLFSINFITVKARFSNAHIIFGLHAAQIENVYLWASLDLSHSFDIINCVAKLNNTEITVNRFLGCVCETPRKNFLNDLNMPPSNVGCRGTKLFFVFLCHRRNTARKWLVVNAQAFYFFVNSPNKTFNCSVDANPLCFELGFLSKKQRLE